MVMTLNFLPSIIAAAKLASPGPTTGMSSTERSGHRPESLTVSISTPA